MGCLGLECLDEFRPKGTREEGNSGPRETQLLRAPCSPLPASETSPALEHEGAALIAEAKKILFSVDNRGRFWSPGIRRYHPTPPSQLRNHPPGTAVSEVSTPVSASTGLIAIGLHLCPVISSPSVSGVLYAPGLCPSLRSPPKPRPT